MRWNLKPEVDKNTVSHLQKVLGVDEVIARLLVQRGITTYEEAKQFFRPALSDLHDPYLMKDMDKAVIRLDKAFKRNEKILVFGDYDVDGTTAVALMSSYIQRFYSAVDTYIPDRYGEGYGISYQGIDYASDNGISLIIALDCGIKSIEHIAYASEKGIDFIICDHHLPGDKLPDAVAVLDPKRVDCSYPYKELCGCGVGFKLIQALEQKKGHTIESLVPYLDLVATAIAADIVPITGENRILAYFGLQVINTEPRPGIKALLALYNQMSFSITDIVFKVAPKINAAGRIEHGNFAVALLTKFTMEEAVAAAEKIVAFNEERRSLDQSITVEALNQIIENKEINNKSTVVFNASWHKGVIGIVASRLIETYYRPTLVFTESGDYLAASARSVKNFDIYSALELCSEQLIQFGGHMYAAGMTLKKENYLAFKNKFEEVVSDRIEEKDLIPEIEIDAILNFTQLTDKFLRILKQFEPFGPGNMNPVFLTREVYDTGYGKTMGQKDEHIRLFVKQAKNATPGYSAVGFNLGDQFSKLYPRQLFDMLYTIEEHEWKGNITWQMQIKDLQMA
jgi:single-stranded-DNA-specific exonuclease